MVHIKNVILLCWSNDKSSALFCPEQTHQDKRLLLGSRFCGTYYLHISHHTLESSYALFENTCRSRRLVAFLTRLSVFASPFTSAIFWDFVEPIKTENSKWLAILPGLWQLQPRIEVFLASFWHLLVSYVSVWEWKLWKSREKLVSSLSSFAAESFFGRKRRKET